MDMQIGHNKPPLTIVSAALEDVANQLVSASNLLSEITNEQMAGEVTLLGKQINAALATIETERKEKKKPHLDAGREVDAAYKEINGKLLTAKANVKKVLTAYQKSLQPDDEGKIKTESAYGHTATLQDRWTFEIKDISLVPRKWLMLNEDKVKAAIRRKDDPVREIPGLVIRNEQQAIVR